MNAKYKGMSIDELKALWEKLKNECFEIRNEIARRTEQKPSVDTDFTKYVTD